MRAISLRLPEDLLAAYEAADGNRSKVMRRRLAEAVENGEVQGVPDDLTALAERELIVDRGRLPRKRATFKERAHGYFSDRWDTGAVTPYDVDELAESWRNEAALYGDEALAFVEAIVDWYAENWTATDRLPQFPSAQSMIARSSDVEVDVDARLVETVQDGYERGLTREQIRERLSTFHPSDRVDAALAAAQLDTDT